MEPPPQEPRPEPDRPARRLPRPDPLLGLALLAPLVVYALLGLQGKLNRDSALYVYAGQLVADGDLPYEGVLNRAGPLAHLTPALGVLLARTFDGDDVMTVRAVFLVISALAVATTYLLGRDLLGSRPAGLAAAATLLAFEGFSLYAAHGPREKSLMVLLLVAALLAATRRRWATAGVLIALATLTWQPVFAGAISGVVLIALLGAEVRWRALLRIAIGGAVPSALVLAAYAVAGKLSIFLDAFVLINARYTQQSSPLGSLPQLWRTLGTGFGWTRWVLVVGMLALLGAGLVAVVAILRRGRTPRRAAVTGTAVALLVSLAWTAKAYDFWPDTFVLLPFAALGTGALVVLVARVLPGRAGAVTGTAVGVAWALAATLLAGQHSLDHRTTVLEDQRGLVLSVMGALPDGARVVSVQGTQTLVFTGQRDPSRFQLFGNGLAAYVDDQWPGGIDAYARWLVDQDAEVIAVDRVLPFLAKPLAEEYVLVSRNLKPIWFVDRDLGKETIRSVREAVRAQRAGLA